MRRFVQTIVAACLCGYASLGVLQISEAEAAAPKTLCDRYLSSRDDAGALDREVSPQGIIKRMELILPACKAALEKYPRDGRINALMARLYGTRNELALSFHHAKTSAELGYPYGAYLMGLIYARGLGVKQDTAESVRWMKTSAKRGSPKAMEQVAKAYIFGQGVKKDPKIAFGWFTKAARAGLNQAFLSLGYMYQEGTAVEGNFKYALIYYSEAKRRRVRGAESQIEALKKKAEKAGYYGADRLFDQSGGFGRYEVFTHDADKKMKERANFLLRFNMKAMPKHELTPEGWDWYERRFDPKNRQ